MDDLLQDFLNETAEHIEAVETSLVSFERNPKDPSPVNQIFRLVHTIKGTSSFLGLDRLQQVAHGAETLIGSLRDGAPPTTAAVSLILTGMDRIRELLGHIRGTGSEPGGDDNDIVSAIGAYLAGESEDAATPDPGLPAHSGNEAAAETPHGGQNRPPTAFTQAPLASASPALPSGLALEVPSGLANASMRPPRPAANGPVATPESIRVAVSTIERIMELVSELVLTRNQLIELTRSRDSDPVKTPLQRLSALTKDLQDAVMRARMQPMTRLFASMPRLIRELSEEVGKKIDLATSGAETELDRQLIEVIRDPLTHLIRNCADHGIERPEQRLAAGKPEFGLISITASHEAGQITIEIRDDGRGLDARRIREKAIARSLASEAEVRAMPDDEIYRFILEPGFSTAETVTTVSGRGVGMDVVRSNIEAIGGTVAIASTPGQGSRFSLKIPLTLAIAPALIIKAGDQRYAVPQHAVVEAVSVGGASRHKLETVQKATLLRLRDDVVPVVNLRSVLGLGGESGDAGAEFLVVIIRVAGATFGIAVDDATGVQDIVVKPLASVFQGLKVFSGYTILGDGAVVLILDPRGLGVHARMETVPGVKPAESTAPEVAGEAIKLVLFSAGRGALKMLPLSLVSRIATVKVSDIVEAGGHSIFRYQDRFIPVVSVDAGVNLDKAAYPVLIVTLDGTPFGLLVAQIVDIVEAPLSLAMPSTNPAVIGMADLEGQAIELLDAGHFFRMACGRPRAIAATAARRILLVDPDSGPRDILIPSLKAAGYEVTAVTSVQDAANLLRRGSSFDAILIDDALRADLTALSTGSPAASGLPMIALGESEAGWAPLAAWHASRFDRPQLLDALAETLASAARTRHATMAEIAA